MAALSTWRAVMAVIAGAALAGLITAEAGSQDVREWWAQRPIVSAFATGLVLLVLTVLVVEAALQRSLSADDERRWAPVGRVACEALLVAVSAAMREQSHFVSWTSRQVERSHRVGAADRDRPPIPPPLGDAVRAAVLEAAPVMTATAHLRSIYASALDAAAAATEVDLFLADWTGTSQFSPSDEPSPMSLALDFRLIPEGTRLNWWGGVAGEWDRFRGAMTAFEDAAGTMLDAHYLVDDEGPAWSYTDPVEERGRREFLAEYGVTVPPPGRLRRMWAATRSRSHAVRQRAGVALRRLMRRSDAQEDTRR